MTKKKQKGNAAPPRDFNSMTSTRNDAEKLRAKAMKNGAGIPGKNRNF